MRASAHAYIPEVARPNVLRPGPAAGPLSAVEIFRDTAENRSRPLRPCGSARFEVPRGGAVVRFEGGGDGEVQALDGRIEIVGALSDWILTFERGEA